MRRFLIPIAVPLLLVAAALPAGAAPPTSGTLTISLVKSPITFGQATTITGTLKDTPLTAAVLVTLESNPAPFKGNFKGQATTTTDTSGSYRFDDVKPELNTHYRTTTKVPKATSTDVLVEVRMKVSLSAKTTVKRGRRARFSGTVAPEHDGRLVYIQRRRAGRWKTVKQTALKDAGSEFSKFSARVRVKRKGTYRAKVFRDADHLDGASSKVRVTVF
jgi:hypothetical protein